MTIKSVKIKITEKTHFFLMCQGSLNPKIRHTDTTTRKWILRTPFQGFRKFSFNLSSRIVPISLEKINITMFTTYPLSIDVSLNPPVTVTPRSVALTGWAVLTEATSLPACVTVIDVILFTLPDVILLHVTSRRVMTSSVWVVAMTSRRPMTELSDDVSLREHLRLAVSVRLSLTTAGLPVNRMTEPGTRN